MLRICGRQGRRSFPRYVPAVHRGFSAVRRRSIAAAAAISTVKRDSIDLPIGLNGGVKLDILSPVERSSNGHERRKVLIHLPSGPSITRETPASLGPFSLLPYVLRPSTSLVGVNYTLGEHQGSSRGAIVFPTPIHEVTSALDYLTSSTSPFNHDHDEPPKICLLGSHIGGALATMLALTEPDSIHALAVTEPMVDWVGLDEVLERLRSEESSSKSAAQKQAQKGRTPGRSVIDNISMIVAAEGLIKLRSKLFKTPSAYFDPFASPILFLRAPGRDTPLAATVGDQMVADMAPNEVDGGHGSEPFPDAFGPYDDDWQPSRPSSAASAGSSSDSPVSIPPRRRKVLRRWPAVGLPEDVSLPHVRIFANAEPTQLSVDTDGEAPDVSRGQAALMRAQSRELSELMRRACFIGREESFAEERVQLRLCSDEIALDSDDEDLPAEIQAMNWVDEMFLKD